MMLILWCGFLLLTHFLCHVHPLKCDDKQEYKINDIKCCKKCLPGERMHKRCTSESPTVCKPCSSDYYMDEHNDDMECKRCTQCTQDHMVYNVTCSKKTDAKCGCISGYKCTDNTCKGCVEIPTTPPPPPPPPTTTTATTTTTKTASSNDKQPTPPSQDTVWITLSLCCVCILLTCFILISRHTPPCGWIMLASTGSFWRSKKNSAESSQCTEDEEVPMPIQEMCGCKEQ